MSDELASPLRHRGLGFQGGVSLRRSGDRSAWDLELLGERARIESRIADSEGGYEALYRATLSYAHLRTVGRPLDGRLQLYVGGRIAAAVHYRSHQYGSLQSEEFAEGIVPLEVAGRWGLTLDPRTRLEHRVSVPLVSLVLRTPYSGLKYVPDLKVAGPSRARGFTSRLMLGRRLTERLGLAAFHRISVFHYPDPLPVSWVGHGFGIELELLR
ncbi:MAG: hypothetical protein GWM92_01120 [Gemmatimonadetes bacterium]|nr:hypothetical protein [Gemmatimonadota bacterium]NIR77066.1 hypothetical protein [Gemmatimonadota bacterium]NIT85586.1 hypothetical protein [Gemmatimonadota bacterium]NIU29418.1 hypothetical protein [Gemmatimonadota bacterium]NIU34483.1 hypothetical protein [Gemmatimonadota bacterium]